MAGALERSYSYKNSRSIEVDYKVEENSFERKPNRGEGWKEFQKTASELADTLNIISVFAKLQTPLKYLKCGLNGFDLYNTTAEFRYISANLRELNKIDRVLVDEIPNNELLYSIYGLKTDAMTSKDFRNLHRYYFSDYDEMKKLSKGIDNRLKELERELKETNNQVEVDDKNREKETLGKNKALLKSLEERVIWLEAFDINKSNKKKCYFKFGTTFMSFVYDIMSLVTFPVLRSAILAIQLPIAVGSLILKFGKVMEKKVNKEKIEDEESITKLLNVPSLLMKLCGILDKHVFKIFRDKAEDLRNKERNRRILNFLRRREGLKNKVDELIKEKEELDEQIEALEKSEDESIKEALRLSKQSVEVLNAKPEGYLRIFKIRTSEDENRMENVAKFVVRHVKGLYLEEEKLEKEKLDKKRLENRLKVSYDRVKAMIIALGIEKDKADDFINDIKEYKKNKLKSIARAGSKEKMDERILKAYRDDKKGFVDELVKAMKSEEEGA